MKDELVGRIVTDFVGLRPKNYTYLTHDVGNDEKAKETASLLFCIIKRRLKFEDYKKCLNDNQIILRSELKFKSEVQNVFTEEINKIVLSFNDDKRLQSFNKVK